MKLSRWLRVLPFIMLLALMMPTAHAASSDASSAEQQAQQTPYATLADMLENEQTRQQLIDQLRQLATQQSDSAAGESSESAPPAESQKTSADTSAEAMSLPRQVASITQSFAENVGSMVTGAIAAIGSLGSSSAVSSEPAFDMSAFLGALFEFALVVVGTVVAFFILRRLASPLFARAGHWVQRDDGPSYLLKRTVAIVLSLLLDVVVILLACVVGYAIGLFGAGDQGSIATRQSLFINAFAIIEIVKALIRMVFAARYEGLRPFAMSAEVARYWNTRLALLVGFIGYGLMVAVPIINNSVSLALGQFASLVIMVLAWCYALSVILSNRRDLHDRLLESAKNASLGFFAVLQRILAKTWHLWAIAYFTVLLVMSQVEPEQALPYIVRATVQTLLAFAIGGIVSALLTRLIGQRVMLPENMRSRLPLLEKRLNAYVPNALKVIRVILLVIVALVVLDAWRVFDLTGWLASEAGINTVAMIVHVAIILLISALIWVTLASVIEHRLSPETGGGEPSAREKTLLSLFRNAIAIAIVTLTVMIVLSQIGINIGPLIAGAGVLGLAIGFGAQKLVQDVITGVFIQLENAMNTGDVVTAGGVVGTAERLTIRSVGIRDLSGTYHVVPFSSVDVVSNYMRDFAYHVGEYGIAYRENVDYAIEQLHKAFEALKADENLAPNILEDMTVPGVVALADSSVNIRIMIKCAPGTQWGIGRAFNKLVKEHFDAAGIEIPFPHTTLYFGQDKNGGAPPANIHVLDGYEVLEGQASAAGQTPAGKASPAPGASTSSRKEDDGDRERLPDSDEVDGSDDGGR
ncbi:mechanosensitive channel protein [Kushneria phosphatilytica]|nr:mechanosensitive channel protein [Kushneria phosphatilytica]OHV07858.1 mechanosensitive ion channel protein MscS [Kushneria phosphatilytica]